MQTLLLSQPVLTAHESPEEQPKGHKIGVRHVGLAIRLLE
jgi:hypothetical protein